MNQALLLTWFPIVLAVGIGGRLLGQARGFGLGTLAALFWVVLVQAGVGTGVWRDPWQASAMACGALVLGLMGGWAGQADKVKPRQSQEVEGGLASKSNEPTVGWSKIAAALEQFDDWLTRHENDREAWPKFAEFVRGVLYESCQATHVKCYRVLPETQELASLDDADDRVKPVSNGSLKFEIPGVGARNSQTFPHSRSDARGSHLPREVAGRGLGTPAGPSTGQLRSEVSDSNCEDGAHSAAVSGSFRHETSCQGAGTLDRKISNPTPCWCFPIKRGGSCIGVVEVGQLGLPEPPRAFLGTVEKLIGLFWLHLVEVNVNRLAGEEDPVSGLLSRPTFLRAADSALRESYEQGEPVALAVVGIQGLRLLNDSGRWEVADGLVHEIGLALQTKARLDDRVGRFDGSRFIWLLRRVDRELAGMIFKHVLTRLEQVCSDRRWGVEASVYCGLAASGSGKPDLRRLVTIALQQSHRARTDGVLLASEFQGQQAGATPVEAGVP